MKAIFFISLSVFKLSYISNDNIKIVIISDYMNYIKIDTYRNGVYWDWWYTCTAIIENGHSDIQLSTHYKLLEYGLGRKIKLTIL